MKVGNRTFLTEQENGLNFQSMEKRTCCRYLIKGYIADLSGKKKKRIYLSKKILKQIRFWRHHDLETKTVYLLLSLSL